MLLRLLTIQRKNDGSAKNAGFYSSTAVLEITFSSSSTNSNSANLIGRHDVLDAIGTCQILVALVSPSYLRSRWCGPAIDTPQGIGAGLLDGSHG